jgi:histidyl-tRNA synthetase
MSSQKPSIPKGTRDFSPAEMVRRNYIFDVIRGVFECYGYLPIETPAMENLSTLMGKYGEEGDKLLFKILNSGDFLQGVPCEKLLPDGDDSGSRALAPLITEKGLRYDLTVPFARFVVQHQHELNFPFKRYQIQPVWRADRPQKGRYREFFQCDVDVIGSVSLLNELELVQIIDTVFRKLDIRVLIRLNNRKILAGIAESIGHPELLTDITVAIDKLDKIGQEKVTEELQSRGVSPVGTEKLKPILNISGGFAEKFALLEEIFSGSETGRSGIAEMKVLHDYLASSGIVSEVDFDLRLARGLSYYTGTIFEVKALEASIGSICGGGRYDDLTGIFGLSGMSGVGISFGADRIYDVMLSLNRFPETLAASTRLLFLNFGPAEERHCLSLLRDWRSSGIPAEIYPDQVKLKKQMEYANRKNIPFVVFIGKDEIEQGKVTLKNMSTGEQKTGSPEEVKQLLIW